MSHSCRGLGVRVAHDCIRPRRHRSLVGLASVVALVSCGEARAEEPITPIPLTGPADIARAALGARLFRDTRLSRNNMQSCASCHPHDRGGADGLQHEMLGRGAKLHRDTPSSFNTAFNIAFNWDGSVRSLEAVINGVVQSPVRFDNTWPNVMAALRTDSAYVAGFKSAYPNGLTAENVVDALASYQRNLITPNARFDKYLRGDRAALTPTEQEGYALFKSFGCVACHQGMNVGGNVYQKFGIFRDGELTPAQEAAQDVGRFWVTREERDRGVFRVPSLRNVELTAPYFHDGRAATLESAVHTMARVQLDRKLSPHEADAIVQFLRTLTGELDGRPLSPAPSSGTQAVRGK